jgi:hypothetical protein
MTNRQQARRHMKRGFLGARRLIAAIGKKIKDESVKKE